MLWDGRSGKARGEFSREPGAVGRLTFDNAGRWLAATCGDRQVRARPFVSRNEGARPAFVWPGVRALASESTRRLLVASGGTLAWRDLGTGKETALFKSPGLIACAATTPDERMVAAISADLHESGRCGGGVTASSPNPPPSCRAVGAWRRRSAPTAGGSQPSRRTAALCTYGMSPPGRRSQRCRCRNRWKRCGWRSGGAQTDAGSARGMASAHGSFEIRRRQGLPIFRGINPRRTQPGLALRGWGEGHR